MLQAETAQQYYPKLLLSDYEKSIESRTRAHPRPLRAGARRPGGADDRDTRRRRRRPGPESQGGYDTGVRNCWTAWHKAYPQIPPGNITDFIEEQGPVVGWCQAIELFATAAKAAGPDLNRRTFVTAMSKITDFPGTWTPRPQLRPGQALRAHRVPGGQIAGQLAAVANPVQADRGPTSARNVLGLRSALCTTPHWLTMPTGSGHPAGHLASAVGDGEQESAGMAQTGFVAYGSPEAAPSSSVALARRCSPWTGGAVPRGGDASTVVETQRMVADECSLGVRARANASAERWLTVRRRSDSLGYIANARSGTERTPSRITGPRRYPPVPYIRGKRGRRLLLAHDGNGTLAIPLEVVVGELLHRWCRPDA